VALASYSSPSLKHFGRIQGDLSRLIFFSLYFGGTYQYWSSLVLNTLAKLGHFSMSFTKWNRFFWRPINLWKRFIFHSDSCSDWMPLSGANVPVLLSQVSANRYIKQLHGTDFVALNGGNK